MSADVFVIGDALSSANEFGNAMLTQAFLQSGPIFALSPTPALLEILHGTQAAWRNWYSDWREKQAREHEQAVAERKARSAATAATSVPPSVSIAADSLGPIAVSASASVQETSSSSSGLSAASVSAGGAVLDVLSTDALSITPVAVDAMDQGNQLSHQESTNAEGAAALQKAVTANGILNDSSTTGAALVGSVQSAAIPGLSAEDDQDVVPLERHLQETLAESQWIKHVKRSEPPPYSFASDSESRAISPTPDHTAGSGHLNTVHLYAPDGSSSVGGPATATARSTDTDTSLGVAAILPGAPTTASGTTYAGSTTSAQQIYNLQSFL